MAEVEVGANVLAYAEKNAHRVVAAFTWAYGKPDPALDLIKGNGQRGGAGDMDPLAGCCGADRLRWPAAICD